MVVAATASAEKIGMPPFSDDFTSVEDLPVLEANPTHAKAGISEETLLLSLAREVEFHRAEIEEGPARQVEMPEQQLALHVDRFEGYLSRLALSYPSPEDEIVPINPDRPV